MRLSALLSLLVLCCSAHASLIQFDSRTNFETNGSELFNETFSDIDGFNATGFRLFGTADKTLSGVTYLAPTFSVVIQEFAGGDSINGHDPLSNVYTNGVFGPIAGAIDNSDNPVNQFGFDLAFVNRPANTRTSNSDFTIDLISNLSSYTIDVLSTQLSHVANGSVFFGFGFTDIAEYFTGFSISPTQANVSPTIDNVTLRTGEVTEPEASQPNPTGLAQVPAPNAFIFALLGAALLFRRAFHFRQ